MGDISHSGASGHPAPAAPQPPPPAAPIFLSPPLLHHTAHPQVYPHHHHHHHHPSYYPNVGQGANLQSTPHQPPAAHTQAVQYPPALPVGPPRMHPLHQRDWLSQQRAMEAQRNHMFRHQQQQQQQQQQQLHR